MVKMFVLQGVYDSGKTSTLTILNDLLREKYPDIDGNPKCSTRGKYKDFQVIYTLTVNGKKQYIGIKTDGDNGDAVYGDVGWLVDNKCNIIFCSCRSYGGTVEAIKRFSEEADVTFVKKTLEADESKRRKVNTADAQKLLALAGL
ncbi:hypothetical protein HMPREF1221_02380 [Treponema socranskii subsp. paredis ATCC 35535]|nr:hypothetical protein HMPREF1221_02380 [Treponema socranskii subsp. paredis ATCC 35535]